MIYAELRQFSNECPKIRQHLTYELCQKFGLFWLKSKHDERKKLQIKITTPNEFVENMLNFESQSKQDESTCDLCLSSNLKVE